MSDEAAARASSPGKNGRSREFVRGIAPIGIVGLGGLLLGLALGLILGAVIPGLREAPTPTQVTVVPRSLGALGGETVVPDVRGLAEKDARQALADHGIGADLVDIVRVPHVSPDGYVVAQDPISGARSPRKVTLSLPEAGSVPDLAGRSEEHARETLIAMGVQVEFRRRYDRAADPGIVLGTDPAPGAALTDTVTVVAAATPQTLFLADIKSAGTCRRVASSQTNGAQASTSVTCPARVVADESVWLLNRRAGKLSGTVGIEDHSDPGASARLVIAGDGRELFAANLRYGASQFVEVDATDVLRLTLTVTRLDGGRGTAVVLFGDAAVTGSVDDLATLEKR